ncbi:MAG TPA: proline--tRNA ligase [Candidatus Kapabacteria bacterium]|nr:proline--tRNA ligase [Candidatus Kapabacteria bacterium]
MRYTESFIPTQREIPAEAENISHQLMLRAGLVQQIAAGVYAFLPLGKRVHLKVEQIIREEMDAIGAQEFLLPALSPTEIWQATGRVAAFGDTLFHIKNREGLVLAPTHEEIMATIAKTHVRSYKELPQIWYQIQTKFRNEPRPKSGVLRGRQFTMKDAYSLDSSWEGLDASYSKHEQAYINIYTRCGLKFFMVGASSGAMGGSKSQEFMVESPAGEDNVALCDNCNYAANVEVASSQTERVNFATTANDKPEEVFTPNIKTIDQLAEFLKIPVEQCAKSRVYVVENEPVLVLMCGNDEVNEAKLQSALGTGMFRAALDTELPKFTGAGAGSIGPLNLKTKMRIIADKRLEGAGSMVCGANKDDFHLMRLAFDDTVKVDTYADLRTVAAGEKCVNCGEALRITRAIEVGHIFKLGTKYSEALGAKFLDADGAEKPIIMGSYGIGLERIMASYIEQNADDKGIIWNHALAPFLVEIVALNMSSELVKTSAMKLYDDFRANGIDVLLDDRPDLSAGVKFNDADLLGMPLQIICGEKNLKSGNVELKVRRTGERMVLPLDNVLSHVQENHK